MDINAPWTVSLLVLLVMAAVFAWFLPSVIVNVRKAKHIRGICVLNLVAVFPLMLAVNPTFFYLTAAIWLAILAWAVVDKKPAPVERPE